MRLMHCQNSSLRVSDILSVSEGRIGVFFSFSSLTRRVANLQFSHDKALDFVR